MGYVFGPVPSRRLGLSLGLDLVKSKTCSFDCIYCQVGKTTQKEIDCRNFMNVGSLLSELKEVLGEVAYDTITLSGSGEPTLNKDIDIIINGIKEISTKEIAILTNGSLLWKRDIRERVRGADIILPTLSTTNQETFQIIHRPHPSLEVSKIVDGLIALRNEFEGLICLEVMLISGINDSEEELEALRETAKRIRPDKIQLNTVVRPPTDKRARPLDSARMEHIKDMFGDRAEVIAYESVRQKVSGGSVREREIIQMAKRRPIRTVDISHALNVELEMVEIIVGTLCKEGKLKQEYFQGEVYYITDK